MADEGKSYGVGGSSGRFRTFIIFIIGLVFVIGIMAYLYHRHNAQGGVESAASLARAPSIGSVPGEATTPEYARTVEQENIRQADEAAKSGGSSVATIVRPLFAGGGEFESSDSAKPGCTMDDLKKARAAGVKASELKCRGCSAKDLRAAGYTAAELVEAGFSAADLGRAGFTAAELKAAGVTAAELLKAGFSPNQLAQAGYSVCDLAQAGTKPNQLQAAGFTVEQMAEAGIGVKPGKDAPKDCNPQGLARAKRSGITAAEMRQLNCGAAALRTAGYTARELKAACYSAAELKAAGFTAAELKEAGFTAAELRAAGYTAKELKDAGFSAKELREGGFSAEQLRKAGYTPDELRAAGYTQGDLQRAGFTAEELGQGVAGNPADNAVLLAAKAALENPCSELSLQNARKQNISVEQLKSFKCTAAQLQNAGFDPRVVAAAALQNPCSDASLQMARQQGISVEKLKTFQCSAAQLTKAGFDPATVAAAAAMAVAGNVASKGPWAGQDAYERSLTPDQRRDLLDKTSQAMENVTGSMFGGWVPPSNQVYIAATPTKDRGDGGDAKGHGGGGRDGGGAGSEGTKKVKGTIVKAGTIMYASLDTSVNSDEKSPILATVVSGPLRGARLIGEFALQGDVVIVNFNKINLPQLPASVAFKGVAIDPETARTALAHNVDNHYLLRYGSLFASSFVSGLATAVSSSGSQSSSGAGGLVITRAPLTTFETILTALGAVGTAYSSVMGANFNTPPTVTIEGGAAIGILLTDDLELPERI
ncbi:MAG: hypothetical protein K2X50_04060 [Gammaproteobacteria bacterium]|nr:hypothetical protein [Gammaproteobacteria bacterium]